MKVSVITPFYNGNEYMDPYQEMLLLNEENMDPEDELEVIIVNDSPKAAVKLQGTVMVKKNWKVIKNPENLGIHGSRLAGLSECTGDYVIFLDQDDELRKDAIACFIAEAKQVASEKSSDGNCHQVIVANALLEQKHERAIWYRTAYHSKKIGDLNTYINIGTQIISPGQCLIPKNLIPDFWKTHVMKNNGADDYFLWILMLQEGVPFTYLDKPLYIHHFTAKNISSDTKETDRSCYEFIEYLEEKEGFPKDYAMRLKEMLITKDAFRNGSVFQKLGICIKKPGIIIRNLVFKLRTHTRYGFNR